MNTLLMTVLLSASYAAAGAHAPAGAPVTPFGFGRAGAGEAVLLSRAAVARAWESSFSTAPASAYAGSWRQAFAITGDADSTPYAEELENAPLFVVLGGEEAAPFSRPDDIAGARLGKGCFPTRVARLDLQVLHAEGELRLEYHDIGGGGVNFARRLNYSIRCRLDASRRNLLCAREVGGRGFDEYHGFRKDETAEETR